VKVEIWPADSTTILKVDVSAQGGFALRIVPAP
jgi:hypothetical protein